MSSIGESHKLQNRDISISFSGSVIQLSEQQQEPQPPIPRIKHIEHDKPFKMTSRNQKIQQVKSP